jgi:membrane protein DedA with SNARE-associated domain
LSDLVGRWGYVAIALVVLLGNVGVPVPEETVLVLGGYLVWQGKLRPSVLILVGVVSAATGDNLGYWLGRRRGQQMIDRYVRGWLDRSDLVERARAFVARRGMTAVFVARFVPGLRCLAGPLAGVAGMPPRRFVVANLLGAVIYVPLVVAAGWAVGYGLGPYLERLGRVVDEIERVVVAALALWVLGALGWRGFKAWRAPRP